MAAYYVDYENVGSIGLLGLEKLTGNDRLILFFSDHADTIKMEIVQALMKTPCQVEFHKIERGTQNALDFQLITMLYTLETGKEPCYIISKDNGYDASIKMAQKLNLRYVQRKNTIEQATRQEKGERVPEYSEGSVSEERGPVPHVRAEEGLNRPIKTDEGINGHLEESKSKEGQTEPVKQENGKQEPVRQEYVKQEPARQEYVKQETARQESGKQEQNKQEAAPAEPETKDSLTQAEIQARIAAVLGKMKVDATPENCRIVEQALIKSKDKYEFYRYFTRRLGQNKGREFYRSIRGGYNELSQIEVVM